MSEEPGELVFLKLGGSVITDKDVPMTARHEVIGRLAEEIASARAAQPGLRLVIGHGSGSFGHIAAARHGTRQGVSSFAGWHGFSEVWYAARKLNQIMVDSLAAAGVPVIAFPPSAFCLAREGHPEHAFIDPIRLALEAGLLPLVAGDVAFDSTLGGTIVSTEDIFEHLAGPLRPGRILLAGVEAGVWRDFPARTDLIATITRSSLPAVETALGASASTDVTGGMIQKVVQMIDLAQRLPGLQAWIFSGNQAGAVRDALAGWPQGTRISA